MGAPSVESGIYKIIVNVPTVGLKFYGDPVTVQVPVGTFGVQTRDVERLVAGALRNGWLGSDHKALFLRRNGGQERRLTVGIPAHCPHHRAASADR